MLEDMNLVQAKGPNSGPNLRYVRRPNSSLELQSGPKSERNLVQISIALENQNNSGLDLHY